MNTTKFIVSGTTGFMGQYNPISIHIAGM